MAKVQLRLHLADDADPNLSRCGTIAHNKFSVISTSIIGRYCALMQTSEAHAGVLHRCATASSCRWALIPLQVAPRLRQHEQQPSTENMHSATCVTKDVVDIQNEMVRTSTEFRRHRGLTLPSSQDTRHTYLLSIIDHSKMPHPLAVVQPNTLQYPAECTRAFLVR